MNCKGIVIYKGIEKRDGGTFNGADGREIKYDASYVVKFDENNNGQINERKLKFPASNTYLYNKFAGIKPYTEILLECDVVFSANACKLVPINVDPEIEETEEDN